MMALESGNKPSTFADLVDADAFGASSTFDRLKSARNHTKSSGKRGGYGEGASYLQRGKKS